MVRWQGFGNDKTQVKMLFWVVRTGNERDIKLARFAGFSDNSTSRRHTLGVNV